jgi:hypothetical protein
MGRLADDSYDTLMAWLFPLTYLFHIAEEYLGDFPANLLQTQGVVLSSTRFVILQSVGLFLMLLGVILSRRLGFANLMLVILAAIVIGNSLIHAGRSIAFGGYEPGLLTSLFFWVPLGTVTLLRGWRRMKIWRYIVGVAIGLAISAAVEMITVTT